MYKILGGDGKEYGPVSAETLQQWIQEGRANAQTQVQAEGAAGWTALGEVTEFSAAFNAPAPAASAPGQFGARPGAMPSGTVPNYLVQSILVTLCCCLPLGVVAIIYAAQVNSKLAGGDLAGAQDSSSKAKMWCWIGFGIGLAINLIIGVIQLIAIVASGASGMSGH